MPITTALADSPAGLSFAGGKLWYPLNAAVRVLEAKLEDHDGQQLVCHDEQCLLMPPEAVRGEGIVPLVDLLWLADALDIGSTPRTLLADRLEPPAETGTQLAADFTLPDLDGRPHSLSEFRGHKTAVYIWGSW